jgi:glycolate oxidase iron-sulfur subunit
MIPGVEVVEIPDGHLCCGSAGTYNLDQPEIAARLGARKAASISSTQPDLVATGNIGCITQIRQHLRAGGAPPVRHTLQILRDAYVGKLSTGPQTPC